jgi:hypothetical protein
LNNGNGSNGNGHHSVKSSYQDHVDRSNSQYVAEFDTWWEGLPPETRRLMGRRGIKGAVVNFSCSAERNRDAADTPAASYNHDEESSGWGGLHHVDFAERVDKLSDQLMEKFGFPLEIAELLAVFMVQTIEQQSIAYKAWLFGKVCGEVLNAKNVKLSVAGLAFASNLAALNGIPSIRAFAKQNHVSPEAVSKVKRKWQKDLLLPDSPHSKDAQARAAYSEVQSSDRHWRKQKFTAVGYKKLCVVGTN